MNISLFKIFESLHPGTNILAFEYYNLKNNHDLSWKKMFFFSCVYWCIKIMYHCLFYGELKPLIYLKISRDPWLRAFFLGWILNYPWRNR